MLSKLPYMDMMYGDELKKIFRPKKTKLHQKTCPVCSARLVNIYFAKGSWACKGCWDKMNHYLNLLGEENIE